MFNKKIKERTIYIDEAFKEHSEENTDFKYEEKRTNINKYVTKITLKYHNIGKSTKIIPLYEKSCNKPIFYFVPCVNYNGNLWGDGKEPKGMDDLNKPWIYYKDRMGLPGAVFSFDGNNYQGIFASKNKKASSSIMSYNDTYIMRTYFANIEYPKVFLRKFEYGKAITNYVSFKENETKTFIAYEFNNPNCKNIFGYDALFDFIHQDYISFYDKKYSDNSLIKMDYTFLESLIEKKGDGYVSNMGLLPNGIHQLGHKGLPFIYRKFGKYEIGWCGQNITIAELFLKRYIKNRNEEDLKISLGILSTWSKYVYKNGIVATNIDSKLDDNSYIDSNNEGWFLYKINSIISLLKSLNINTAKYEKIRDNAINYYLNNFKTGMFPQIIDVKGNIIKKDGCAGTIMILGFLSSYQLTKNKDYLKRGIEAYKCYNNTYLTHSLFAGGALDTYCIDKESAGPMLKASLLLYEITNDKNYIEDAKKIASYLMTWCFYHDVKFKRNTDCYKLKIKTTGSTAVSTCHNHIDCWGLFYVSDFIKLYKITKRKTYKIHAEILWNFTVQYVSDGSLKLHGMLRPLGAENEAIIQCNWHSNDEKVGILNDWLVAWVKAFQIDTYYQLKELKNYGKQNN